MACLASPILDQQINSIGKQLFLRSDIGEELIATFYLRMKQDGMLQVFFHENPEISLSAFLRWHTSPTMEAMGCFVRDIETGSVELAGMGYINNTKRYGDEATAEVGLGFLRKFQSRSIPLEFAGMLLDYCFLAKRLVAVHGVSPCGNRAIHTFARRVGFKAHGPLPFFSVFNGSLQDSMLYSMRGFDWIKGRR